jgi:hypothetical protein
MPNALIYHDRNTNQSVRVRRTFARLRRRRELEPLDLRTPSGRRLPY